MGSRISTLILHCDDALNSYYKDWLSAFTNHDSLIADSFNLYDLHLRARLAKTISNYEMVICLYSCSATAKNLKFLLSYVPIIQKRRGKLLMFIGNELNDPFPGGRISDRIELLKHIEPDFLGTQLLLESAKYIYQDITRMKVLPMPHALNPKVFYSRINRKDRPVEIGMRTGKYPSYLGDSDRNDIVELFRDKGSDFGLNVDVDNVFSNKLDPENWANLLSNCKGTVGNEAGTAFLEKDDETVDRLKNWIYEKEGLSDGFLRKLRWDIFTNYNSNINYPLFIRMEHYLSKIGIVNFENENQQFVANFELNSSKRDFFPPKEKYVSGKCISSRHFDAAGCETVQVLLEGRYNDILIENEHYIKVNKDYSNLKEAIDRFKDEDYCAKMVKSTREYLIDEHLHKHRIDTFLKEL